MEHKEKINYMRIAAGIVGYGFDEKGLDMLISMYDLVLEKEGQTDLNSIVKIRCEVEEREEERIKAERIRNNTILEESKT